jgi:hypothetical protein
MMVPVVGERYHLRFRGRLSKRSKVPKTAQPSEMPRRDSFSFECTEGDIECSHQRGSLPKSPNAGRCEFRQRLARIELALQPNEDAKSNSTDNSSDPVRKRKLNEKLLDGNRGRIDSGTNLQVVALCLARCRT